MKWTDVFAAFRTAAQVQGIAARYAGRQATDDEARRIGEDCFPYAEMVWDMIEKLKEKTRRDERVLRCATEIRRSRFARALMRKAKQSSH